MRRAGYLAWRALLLQTLSRPRGLGSDGPSLYPSLRLLSERATLQETAAGETEDAETANGNAGDSTDSQPSADAQRRNRGRKVGEGLTLQDYEAICELWHPVKNLGIGPGDITHGSAKRIWLQCRGCPRCGKAHEWDARAHALTQLGGDIVCPYCACRTAFCSCRSVATDPRLLAEWHEDNPPATEVAISGAKKVLWRCKECGNVWAATPVNRSTYGSRCPICAHCRPHKHGTLAAGRPDLAAEWDPARNTKSPSEVKCGSDSPAWWICGSCSWSWQATVVNRAVKGSGCPNCQELHRGEPRKRAVGEVA